MAAWCSANVSCRRPRRRLRLALAALGLLLGPSAGPAAARPVDVALVLALDSSSSVTPNEFELQTDGLAAAFRNPAVRAAIASNPTKAIAVMVMEWSNGDFQTVDMPWTIVDGDAAADHLADDLENQSRLVWGGGTSIGGAIEFALGQLRQVPAEPQRRVIDVSGDGRHNMGPSLEAARAHAAAADVTINGLAMINEEPDLLQFYRQSVILGRNAFALRADDYRAFAAALVEKLTHEISDVPMSALPGPVRLARRGNHPAQAGVCGIGHDGGAAVCGTGRTPSVGAGPP